MNTKVEEIDIANITPGERTITVNHPATGAPLIKVNLMSADDKRLKVHQRRLVDKQNEKRRKNKFLSAEETEKGIVELIAYTITGWDWGSVKYKGQTPEFSLRNAIEILSDPNISWFFDQVNEAVGETKDFFQQ